MLVSTNEALARYIENVLKQLNGFNFFFFFLFIFQD